MDTNLKSKYKELSLFLGISIIIVLIIFLGLDISRNTEFIFKNPYFQSQLFSEKVSKYVDLIIEKNENRIYLEKVVEDLSKEKKAEDLLDESEGKNKDDIKEKQAEVEKELKFISDRNPSLKYYFKDYNTNYIETQLDYAYPETIKSSRYMYEVQLDKITNWDSHLYQTGEKLRKDMNTLRIFVEKKNYFGDSIHEGYRVYEKKRIRILSEIAVFLAFIIILILSIIHVLKKKKLEKFIFFARKCNNFPIDIAVIIFVVYTFLVLDMFSDFYDFFNFPIGMRQVMAILVGASYIIFTGMQIVRIYDIKTSGDVHYRENLMIRKWKFTLKEVSILKILGWNFFKFVIFTLIAMLGALAVLASGSIGIFLFVVIYEIYYLGIYLPNMLKKLSYVKVVLDGAKAMGEGDLDLVLEEREGSIGELARSLNRIREGFKIALEERMKSERLKSELITNVSHDLKTPLTSMISYIELLKNHDIREDEREKYTQILDRKTKRLKSLIEDLFEVSKMASGSIEMKLEDLDLVELINQSLGEYQERIEESSLEFKTNIPNQTIISKIDGQRTWRVFDNLIGNILKYTMKNTRVYIDMELAKDCVRIEFKNISSYEMNFAEDEIVERFKRGDKSRNTEGSGLGLAIAKSIMDLQDGNLNIKVDGDLFKVILYFKTA